VASLRYPFAQVLIGLFLSLVTAGLYASPVILAAAPSSQAAATPARRT